MRRRESINVTLYKVPLTVYGEFFTNENVFELDRVEAGDGIENIVKLLNEDDVAKLNEAATAIIMRRYEESRLGYDRENVN